MVSFIVWLIVGAIAGALAGTAMRGHGYGIGVDIVVGIIGSILGGWLLSLLGLNFEGSGLTGLVGSIIVAFIGAVVLIAIVRALAPGRTRL